MCVSDWRLGRLISTQETQVAGAAASLAFPASMQRVGILVSTNTPQTLITIYTQIVFANGYIHCLSLANSFMLFTLKDHGRLPTLGFTIQGVGITSSAISVVEMFLPEDVIQAGLDSIKSEYRL